MVEIDHFDYIEGEVFLNPQHLGVQEASMWLDRGLPPEDVKILVRRDVQPLFLTPDPQQPNVRPIGIAKKVSYYIPKHKSSGSK